MTNAVGRPRKYDNNAEKVQAYRQRVERERWALADEVDRLRRRLEAQGDREAADLLGRVQGALHNGRPRKSDPVRSGQPAATKGGRSGTVTLREAVTLAATTERPQPPKPTAPAAPRRLTAGEVPPMQPHHLGLIADLRAGGELIEASAGRWTLTTTGGQRRDVDSRTIAALLRKGILSEHA